jgi:hypothetical protein
MDNYVTSASDGRAQHFSKRKQATAWVIASAGILITACTLPKRRGDATVLDHKDFLFVVVDDLVFPWMTMNSHHLYHFKARHLPAAVYPDRIELIYPPKVPAPWKSMQPERGGLKMSREEIQTTNQVWRYTTLKIEFRSPDGKPFFERTVNLEPQRGGPSYDERRGTAVLQFLWEPARRSLLNLTDYDVEVEVIPPAEKIPLEARLFTQKKIY